MKQPTREYHVESRRNGRDRCERFPANGPGQAFRKCLKAYPAAVLLAYELRDTSFIRYQAPRNQTMPAEPSAHGAVQMMMAFYAEILSRRKM
jgi:hypothetical protein